MQGAGLDKNFNRFWFGETMGHIAVQLGAVALPVISVELLHATESDLGYLNAASTAAFLFLGLPAGAWVDRWFKRPVMIWANLVRGLAIAAVPALWFTGLLTLWQLYVVAAVIGIATVFFDVAYTSFIPMLVARKHISAANSRLEASAQLARLAGPALGGVLLKVMSAPILLLADAVGYLISWAFLIVTRDHEEQYRAETPPRPRRRLVSEISEGLQFVARQPAVSRITIASCINSFTVTATFTLAPIVVLRLIGVSAFYYGLLMTVGAIGGLFGAGAATRIVRRFGTANTIRYSILVNSLSFLAYPFALLMDTAAASMTVLLSAAVVGNFAGLIYNVTQMSLRQRLCPPHLLGRMNASVRFVVWGIMPISSLIAGWASEAIGVGNFLWITAVAGLATFLPLLRLGPHITD